MKIPHSTVLLFALLSVSVSALPLFPSATGLGVAWLSQLRGMFTPCLVQTSADAPAYWTTEMGKHLLFLRGVKYIDITAHPELGALSASRAGGEGEREGARFPGNVSYAHELGGVFGLISEAGPRADLAAFTAFRTRYYRSQSGRDSQAWLLARIKHLVASARRTDVDVREFPHEWGQNSIILRFHGAQAEAEGVTILGAHQDSTNLLPFLAAPGADDDGSGTVTILETLRVLLAAGWTPASPVEWHWYSAEEGGLLGSQAVAAAYERSGTKVKAMLQQDMTAFVKAGTDEVVGIVSDFVNTNLAEFLKVLVDAYLDIPYVDTKIGYAASDHASWSKIGAPSAFAIEATYENSNLRRIHTTNDVYDIPEYSFPHLLRFVRLSAAFAVELGGWSKQ